VGAGRIVRLAASLVVGVLPLVECSTEHASRVVDGTTTTRVPGTPQESFTIGEEIQLGDLRLTVHRVIDDIRPLNPSTTVHEGRHWIGVDVSVENISTDEVNVSALVEFAVVDATNEQYAARTPDRNDGFPELDGDIAAGGSRRGTIIFEVPRDARGLRLFFAGDPLASGSVQVVLTD
jgi:uncharacterized protein DUF4352